MGGKLKGVNTYARHGIYKKNQPMLKCCLKWVDRVVDDRQQQDVDSLLAGLGAVSRVSTVLQFLALSTIPVMVILLTLFTNKNTVCSLAIYMSALRQILRSYYEKIHVYRKNFTI